MMMLRPERKLHNMKNISRTLFLDLSNRQYPHLSSFQTHNHQTNQQAQSICIPLVFSMKMLLCNKLSISFKADFKKNVRKVLNFKTNYNRQSYWSAITKDNLLRHSVKRIKMLWNTRFWRIDMSRCKNSTTYSKITMESKLLKGR